MAATERTQYYDLPIFNNNDTTDWLDGGFNQAMEKLDSSLHTLDVRVNEDTENIGGVTDQINTLATSVMNLSNEVQGLQSLQGEFDSFKTQVEGDITSITELANSAIASASTAESTADTAAAGVEAVKGSGWSENPYTLVQAKTDVGTLETGQAATDVKVTDLQGRVSDLEAGGGSSITITKNDFTIIPRNQTLPFYLSAGNIDTLKYLTFYNLTNQIVLSNHLLIFDDYSNVDTTNKTENFGFTAKLGWYQQDFGLPRITDPNPVRSVLHTAKAPSITVNVVARNTTSVMMNGILTFYYSTIDSLTMCLLLVDGIKPSNLMLTVNNIIDAGLYMHGGGTVFF